MGTLQLVDSGEFLNKPGVSLNTHSMLAASVDRERESQRPEYVGRETDNRWKGSIYNYSDVMD